MLRRNDGVPLADAVRVKVERDMPDPATWHARDGTPFENWSTTISVREGGAKHDLVQSDPEALMPPALPWENRTNGVA